MKVTVDITFRHALLIISILMIPFLASAQKSNSISYQSLVVDENLEGIGGAFVKNMNSNDIAITDTSGAFVIQCHEDDSLIISAMTYELKKVYVNPVQPTYISLKRMVNVLDQVDVYDFKGWEAFKKEFVETEVPGPKVNVKGLPAGKAYSQKPIALRTGTFESKPGPLHFIVSPFSSIAYYTSKKEKAKRDVWRRMIRENNERAYWNVMHKDSILKWVKIPDREIDDFILFCNDQITDKTLGKEYYYKEKIVELYPLFKQKED